MNDEIGVNTITLKSENDSIRDELNAIMNNIDELFSAMSVLDSMWDGTASEAFKQQFMNDKENLELFCNTVMALLDSMDFAKGEYDKCESQIESVIGAIRV